MNKEVKQLLSRLLNGDGMFHVGKVCPSCLIDMEVKKESLASLDLPEIKAQYYNESSVHAITAYDLDLGGVILKFECDTCGYLDDLSFWVKSDEHC